MGLVRVEPVPVVSLLRPDPDAVPAFLLSVLLPERLNLLVELAGYVGIVT